MTKPPASEAPLPAQVLPDDDSEKTLSLLTGIARPEGLPQADVDMPSASGASKVFNQGTLLILMVFAIAAGTLYAMRLSRADAGSTSAVKSAEAKIEDILTRVAHGGTSATAAKTDPTGGLKDANSIAAWFSEDPTKRQVPIEYLKKNPFLLPRTPVMEETPSGALVVVTDRTSETRKRLEAEFKDLKLSSIVAGARPVAVINDEVVAVGQTVGNFTITSITGVMVELTAENLTFKLSLEQKPDSRSRTRTGR